MQTAPVPYHVAIIPDGNRRWAAKRFLPKEMGHMVGYDRVVSIVQAAKQIGIKAITLFAFSTENWKRPDDEIAHLMKLTEEYLTSYQQKLIEEGIRLSAIGNLEKLPKSVRAALNETIEKTKTCTDFDLILAINYGGRDELVRAVAKIVEKQIEPSKISETMITEHLDTKSFPDPDLVIRTSGESRLSNFLLWQSSYAEVYIETASWPDYTPEHLLAAVRDYQRRERRLGGQKIHEPA